MSNPRRRFDAIDYLLLTAIVVLSGVLCWQAIDWWKGLPWPGRQVTQLYVAEDGDSQKSLALWADYLIYLPADYRSKKNWPLVVFLHGAGDRGDDIDRVRRNFVPQQAETGQPLPFVLISPQCPKQCGWSPELIVGLVEHVCGRFSIDRDRVYLTGYSMGGHGTWATACHRPDLFAAIAPLAGGGNAEEAGRLVNLPIWAFHGAKDDVVPLDGDQKMVEAVRRCGGHVEFTIYPELGHGIATQTYRDPKLLEWLLAQRRPARSVERQ